MWLSVLLFREAEEAVRTEAVGLDIDTHCLRRKSVLEISHSVSSRDYDSKSKNI